jgi:hypothetical protein
LWHHGKLSRSSSFLLSKGMSSQKYKSEKRTIRSIVIIYFMGFVD